MLLQTVNFAFTVTRNQQSRWTHQPINADGTNYNSALITHSKLIISHATTRDAGSIIYTFTDTRTLTGTSFFVGFNNAFLETLPLGTFAMESLIQDASVPNLQVSAQGTITVLPCIGGP